MLDALGNLTLELIMTYIFAARHFGPCLVEIGFCPGTGRSFRW
jgi:hypothetical protein